jgi:hypothetical protein
MRSTQFGARFESVGLTWRVGATTDLIAVIATTVSGFSPLHGVTVVETGDVSFINASFIKRATVDLETGIGELAESTLCQLTDQEQEQQ